MTTCSQYLNTYINNNNNNNNNNNKQLATPCDTLWTCIRAEVLSGKPAVTTATTEKPGKGQPGGGKGRDGETNILSVLYACLAVVKYYQDVYYTLKEGKFRGSEGL